MLKAVIFDFDGTIGDTLGLCIEAFKKVIEPLTHRTYTAEEVMATFGPNEEGTIRNVVPEHYEEALKGYIREYSVLHNNYPGPFPGIIDILNYLKKRGCIIALVTGKGKMSCDISLKYYKMQDTFDWIETGSPLGPCKPTGIRRVLDHFQLLPKEAVYVGDVPSDITASREVGIPIISAAWSSTARPEELVKYKPDWLCSNVDQMKTILEDL